MVIAAIRTHDDDNNNDHEEVHLVIFTGNFVVQVQQSIVVFFSG